MELAYSIHLGSDKNKKNSVRASDKTNKSGTTSMSNNAKNDLACELIIELGNKEYWIQKI